MEPTTVIQMGFAAGWIFAILVVVALAIEVVTRLTDGYRSARRAVEQRRAKGRNILIGTVGAPHRNGRSKEKTPMPESPSRDVLFEEMVALLGDIVANADAQYLHAQNCHWWLHPVQVLATPEGQALAKEYCTCYLKRCEELLKKAKATAG